MFSRFAIAASMLALSLVGASAAAQNGSLVTVTSEPEGAAVVIDGVAVGRTPIVGLPLTAGRHLVESTYRGTNLTVRDLDLADGQQLTLTVPTGLVVERRPAPNAALSVPVAPSKKGGPWLGVPWPTWISGGVAAVLFGVGLGFGISAANIDHQAANVVSASGVDQGITRATAVAGQQDAIVCNGLMIGAGVATLVGLGFAAFAPESAPEPVTTAGSGK